jgi:N-acetylglucosaminyldiphosphoundecaprenol N-acetyl-beta-D-mannosaminyltransferase
MDYFKRINILGCPFDVVSFSETLACIKNAVLENKRLHVVTGNVDFVMKAKRNPTFRKELWEADLVVADGVPILWAASLLGNRLRGRVNGTDLVWKCAEMSAGIGCTVALIGGKAEVAQRAAEKMKVQLPNAELFPIPTPFPLGARDNEKLVDKIKGVMARIVLVALGAPLQERWVESYLERTGANVGIGIGSALDIICGDRPRAPRWMSANGMEWLHRMLLEPRRLGRRYLVEDSPFLIYLAFELARRRIGLGMRQR